MGIADESFAEIAARVNAQATTWTAEVPSRFENMDDVRMLCGTVLKGRKGYKEYLEEKSDQEIPNEDIAADFDVRTNWPKCASVSGHIRDQSACGSCWAFGSTEAFNDRRCIVTGDTTLMSTEDTTANCGLLQCMSMGCGGGQPGAAWNWFQSKGVVTGGDYDDIGKGDTCGPYTLKPCAHHVPASSKYPACPSSEYSTPSLSSCDKSYSKSYSSDKKKASGSYSLSGVSKIQSDIQQHGSVTAAVTVYADFPTYKSGVYKHTTGSALGGHAVKILGWGTESGQDYWLVANSWNEQWGDQGLFKIARGVDECGIESQISAGTVSADAVVV
jgi:cathepsin B